MKKNYEIKSCLSSVEFQKIIQRISKIKSFKHSAEKQKDIYYKVKYGRLKLRIINDKTSNLILYNRHEKNNKRVSKYLICATDNFRELDLILRGQFDVLARVLKKREIYIKDNIRIHLDTVKDLGKFLEIEIIYDNISKAKKQMKEQIKFLNLNEKDFIKVSYSDLLINKK